MMLLGVSSAVAVSPVQVALSRWPPFRRSVGAAAAVTKRVHAIVKSLHFEFANEPRHYRGQVAAKLAN
jgi:hypothetical protein